MSGYLGIFRKMELREYKTSLVAQTIKRLGYNVGDLGSIPRSERSYREGNANPLQYSCRKIPWTEEHGGLQSTGSQRVRHNWATSLQANIQEYMTYLNYDKKSLSFKNIIAFGHISSHSVYHSNIFYQFGIDCWNLLWSSNSEHTEIAAPPHTPTQIPKWNKNTL